MSTSDATPVDTRDDDCTCRHPMRHLASGRCPWPGCGCAAPVLDMSRMFCLSLPPWVATRGSVGAAAAIALQEFARG